MMVEPQVRSIIQRRLLIPVGVALALTTAVVALGVQISPWAQFVPFLASLLVLGLPHGALDHLVPARISLTPVRRSVTGVSILYLVLGAVVLATWLVFPLAAFVIFIGITWYHWGQGDLHAVVAFHGATHLRSVLSRALTIVVRGGLPMLVPLLAFPEAYLNVVTTTAALFRDQPPIPAGAVENARRLGVIVLPTAAILLFSMTAVHRRRIRITRSWLTDLAEVLLLATFFAVVPPILAVGMYFCFWHALRHIVRLQLIDTAAATALRAGQVARSLRIFARDAVPTTAVALLVLVIATVITGVTGGHDASRLLGVYLVLLSALTLPHVVIVTYMDHRERLWVP